jgi:bacterioferritin-associated ferredoxin
MYICHCNVITDHNVRDCLGKTEGRATMAKVYKACSGGENPNCGKCLPTIKEMVRAHNACVAVREIEKQLPAAAPKTPQKAVAGAGKR